MITDYCFLQFMVSMLENCIKCSFSNWRKHYGNQYLLSVYLLFWRCLLSECDAIRWWHYPVIGLTSRVTQPANGRPVIASLRSHWSVGCTHCSNPLAWFVHITVWSMQITNIRTHSAHDRSSLAVFVFFLNSASAKLHPKSLQCFGQWPTTDVRARQCIVSHRCQCCARAAKLASESDGEDTSAPSRQQSDFSIFSRI